MKKIFAVLLILALTLSLCACAKTPEQLLSAAGEALAEEKYTEAVDYLNELLVQEPENIEALSTLAETYTAMGDTASAEATLRTLTALQPDNADFVARLADMYLANGKNTEALAQYDKLVELGGTPSDELYELWLSTPLFDIQDEAVFNQKVDELYAEIEGKKYEYDGVVYIEIDSREQAELILKFINFDFLSEEQINTLNPDLSNWLYGEFMNALTAINSDNIKNGVIFSYGNYIVNPIDRKSIVELETNIFNNTCNYELLILETQDYLNDDKMNEFTETLHAILIFVTGTFNGYDSIDEQSLFYDNTGKAVSDIIKKTNT